MKYNIQTSDKPCVAKFGRCFVFDKMAVVAFDDGLLLVAKLAIVMAHTTNENGHPYDSPRVIVLQLARCNL